MSKGYFGAFWNVPATELLDRLPTPVGDKCIDCQEIIGVADQGYIVPCVLRQDEVGRWVTEFLPIHRECQLLATVGHTFGYCNCNNYQGLTRRQGAIKTWDAVQAHNQAGTWPEEVKE